MEQTEKLFVSFLRNWILTFYDNTSYLIINMILDQGSVLMYQDIILNEDATNKRQKVETKFGPIAEKYFSKFHLKKHTDKKTDVLRTVIENLQVCRIIEHTRTNANKELSQEEQEEQQKLLQEKKKQKEQIAPQRYLEKIGIHAEVIQNIDLILTKMLNDAEEKKKKFQEDSYMCKQCNYTNPSAQEIEQNFCNGCTSTLFHTKDEAQFKLYSNFFEVLKKFEQKIQQLQSYRVPEKYLCQSCIHEDEDEQGNASDRNFIFGFKSTNLKDFLNTYENITNNKLNILKYDADKREEMQNKILKEQSNQKQEQVYDKNYVKVDFKQHDNIQKMQTILQKRREKEKLKEQEKQQNQIQNN